MNKPSGLTKRTLLLPNASGHFQSAAYLSQPQNYTENIREFIYSHLQAHYIVSD